MIGNWGGRTACGLIVAIVAVGAASCGSGVSFRMSYPQSSEDNRFIGPDLEMSFSFQRQSVRLVVFNTGDADAIINWDQATFVSAGGEAVRLVSAGRPLLYTIPAGSRASAELTLATWHSGRSSIWRRRAHLKKQLVHESQAEQEGAQVRLIVPVRKMGLDGSVVDEVMEFVFAVSTRAKPEDAGGGYTEPPIF